MVEKLKNKANIDITIYEDSHHSFDRIAPVIVNEKAYNSLPKDLQQILTVAMKTAAYDMYVQSYHESAINLASLKKDYPNVKMRSFPKSVMNVIQQTNTDLLKEFSAKDPMTAEILKSLSEYQNKARAWTNLSDRAYLDNFDSK